ncbi:MAG: PKD domain-containing protein [Euryarchaeota archaeon]|nr:PKD domain-containing protein [Euryarchaeota archaeon]
MVLTGDSSTHGFNWFENSIDFFSFHGHYNVPPNSGYIINQWEYTGSYYPQTSNEKVHLNLWLYDSDNNKQGDPPSNEQEVEIVFKKFDMVPQESPQVKIIASPTGGNVPLTVTFSATVSGGTPPYSYSWNFGDGTTGTGKMPIHTYESPINITYTATCTVTDEIGRHGEGISPVITVTMNKARHLTVVADKLYFVPGGTATFSGRITDDKGNGDPGVWVGVDDPVRGVCDDHAAITDSEGRFSYMSTVIVAGRYWFTFYVDLEIRHIIVDVWPIQEFAALQSLTLSNNGSNSSKTLVAKIYLGNTFLKDVIIPVGDTARVILVKSQYPPISATDFYCPIDVGVGAYCRDRDGTMSVSVGEELFVRGYWKTNDGTVTDFGVCVGVGVGVPVEPLVLKGDIALCVGKGGANIEISGGAGIGWQTVGETLRVDIVTLETVSDQQESSLTVEAHCPVDIMVYDLNNKRVGYDPTTMESVNEISGSLYSGPYSDPETIFIPNAASEYTLKIFGNGFGDYHIKVRKVVGQTVSEYWINGTISPEVVYTETIDMPSQSPQSVPGPTITEGLFCVIIALILWVWKKRKSVLATY